MLVTAGTADGAVPTEIVDGWGAEDSLSLRPHVSLDWEWRRRRGAIRRETLCYAHETLGGASLCPEGSRVLLADDLETERTTSVLTVTPALALGDAFELSFALPIVLSEQTDLRHASGVDEGNSLTDPYNRPSLFEVPARGPTRAGLADVSATLRVAPFGFGEERDGRWVVGLTLTLPTASERAAGNDAVGEGMYAVRLENAFSGKVTRWLEPFAAVDVTLVRGAAGSVFDADAPTQTLTGPAHRLGVSFGAEVTPYERKDKSAVRLEVGGRIEAVFDGRARTDLFDALGTSGCDPRSEDAPCDLTTYDRGDVDPATSAPRRTDGVTDEEHHAVLSGWLGIRYEVFEVLELSARASLAMETDHFLTFADVGEDLDGVGGIQRTNTQGQNELNPVYASAFDAPGTRFRTGGITTFGVDVAARVKF
ncbi:MAG: hypothetical protein KC635_12250 [Myxococcales bacterium]|nr:hypothetical protein [Myxococcales bacterium]MCB9735709.1 hypothetical protein [Deltaproteobacteria bacterium]